MKKMLHTFMLVLLLIPMLSYVCFAEDLSKITDKFYAGLADIIERNMDNPGKCVQEVEGYYQKNHAVVVKIREAAEKAMAQAAPMMEEMMDKYSSMSEEQLKAMEKKFEGMGKSATASPSSTGFERYSQALDTFMTKHPRYGMQVAAKALLLVPAFNKFKPE